VRVHPGRWSGHGVRGDVCGRDTFADAISRRTDGSPEPNAPSEEPMAGCENTNSRYRRLLDRFRSTLSRPRDRQGRGATSRPWRAGPGSVTRRRSRAEPLTVRRELTARGRTGGPHRARRPLLRALRGSRGGDREAGPQSSHRADAEPQLCDTAQDHVRGLESGSQLVRPARQVSRGNGNRCEPHWTARI
jgi:hypothetical protein